jgi:hypothetical protein
MAEPTEILEDATVECKTCDIDTPEVREALDVLAPHCRPEWKITGFRDHLKRHEEFGPGGEGQQQNLRVNFSGIYSDVRQLIQTQIRRLQIRYAKSKDATVKAEVDRLPAELQKMPERWKFVSRSF